LQQIVSITVYVHVCQYLLAPGEEYWHWVI